MGSMFGIWSPCIYTYSSQTKNTCLSSLIASQRNMPHSFTRWWDGKNGLSSGWSLWVSEKMMEPPDTLNTTGAEELTQCLCCLLRGFSGIVQLHPAHSLYPTKVHTDLGRRNSLSQKGFLLMKSHISSKPPRPIPGSCISAGYLLVSSWPQIFF